MLTIRGLALSVISLLGAANVALADFVTTATPVHPSGVRAAIDLPGDQHIRNVGGSDGSGLCVGTSQEVASRWQNLNELKGFQAWLQRRPGGSYPEMLAKDLKTFAASKGVTLPDNVQHTGGDIALLRLALKTRRMVGMTYAGMDNFYGQQGIAHMVDGAHLDGKYGAIIDNNQPGSWRWMDDAQLCNRWRGKKDDGSDIMVTDGRQRFAVGGGWLVAWLGPPPPPIDTTSKDYLPEASVPADPYNGDVLPEPIQPDPVWPDLTPDEWKLNNGIDLAFARIRMLPTGVRHQDLVGRMRYWVNGVEVDRPTAFRVMAAGVLNDDTDKPFVSVVGDVTATRDALKPFLDKIHLNVYTPDSWVVKTRLKMKVTAQLAVSAGGKTVYASDDVTPTSLLLAVQRALGVADPKPPVTPLPPPIMPVPTPPVVPLPPGPTPPVVDPTPASPPSPPAPTPVEIPYWVIAAAAFLGYKLSQPSATPPVSQEKAS